MKDIISSHILALFATSISTLILTACGQSQSVQTQPEALSITKAEDAQTVGLTGSETPADMQTIYANFLKTYITEKNGINYLAYSNVNAGDKAALKAYVKSLETRGTDGLSRDEEMAFWFNLYNAKTIDVILDAYPLKSIRKLGPLNSGPWDKKNMNVVGKGQMSLNDVEHGTLRKNWQEPRIHYAVNCASIGCPNLKATPWTAENLEADLRQAAIDYINHPRGFNVEGGKVTASKIFDWYKEDFGGNKAGILAHARQYAKGNLKTALDAANTIHDFGYDWDLNEE